VSDTKKRPEATETDELMKFLERAQSGDASTLPELRKMLQDPAAIRMLGGELAEQAEQSFIRAASGDNLPFREALTRKLELMRSELSGPNPTPVERLLVERVVACWLQVQDADIRFAQAKDLSIPWWKCYQLRMDRAHKRYLSALKALALVRKLALPVLQVNIARKQVNVAGRCVNAEARGTPSEPDPVPRLPTAPGTP
jgi:hypothetical protein